MTRAKVTEEAAVTALQDPARGQQDRGWVFSTDQQRKGVDYRELARVEQLDTAYRRQDLARPPRHRHPHPAEPAAAATPACTTRPPRPTQKMVAEYDPDPRQLGRHHDRRQERRPGWRPGPHPLLAKIKATSRGDRPVRIITIGMGEADPKALKAISRATGGTSYIANTPADIQRVFVQALLARTVK